MYTEGLGWCIVGGLERGWGRALFFVDFGILIIRRPKWVPSGHVKKGGGSGESPLGQGVVNGV